MDCITGVRYFVRSNAHENDICLDIEGMKYEKRHWQAIQAPKRWLPIQMRNDGQGHGIVLIHKEMRPLYGTSMELVMCYEVL